jgi:hypothetical protein
MAIKEKRGRRRRFTWLKTLLTLKKEKDLMKKKILNNKD